MVSGAVLLFIRGIVLLVHDDEAQILNRGKHGRAGAYGNAGLAAVNGVPFIESLAVAHCAVENGHVAFAAGKAALESRHCLRGERYFRHQDEDSLTLDQRMARSLQIHLCLAGTSHPLQEEWACAPGIERTRYLLQCCGLFRIQFKG